MKFKVLVKIPNSSNITLELDNTDSPKTVRDFIDNLPFTVSMNFWGNEIYTNPSPISQKEENAKSLVQLNDVAYWPTGRAICLFYGSTPIGNLGEIKPYSPVNVIGKILDADKSVLKTLKEGIPATFSELK